MYQLINRDIIEFSSIKKESPNIYIYIYNKISYVESFCKEAFIARILKSPVPVFCNNEKTL